MYFLLNLSDDLQLVFLLARPGGRTQPKEEEVENTLGHRFRGRGLYDVAHAQ